MLKINKVLFAPTGTYDDQVFRPYKSDVSGNIATAYMEATANRSRIDPSTIAGVAGSILRPTTEAIGQVAIPNGWGQQRLRFLMEVETTSGHFSGSAMREIITGYTDHPGFSRSGALDPQMRLYFNNAMLLNHTVFSTPNGANEAYRVIQSAHVVPPPQMAGNISFQYQQAGQIHLMTPADIVGKMQTTAMPGMETLDLRNGFVGNELRLSKRSNGMASDYLSRTINGLQAGVLQARQGGSGDYFEAGVDDMSALDYAKNNLVDGSISNNLLLSHLLTNTGMRMNHFVTVGELQRLFPEFDAKSVVAVQGTVQQVGPSALRGNSEYWTTSTNETVAATMLAYSVPAIMMDLMLTKFSFFATNMTLDGQFQIQVRDARSFSTVNLAPYIQRALDRLTMEVLPDITYRGQAAINLAVQADIMGDTFITISFAGGPNVDYVLPTFSDGLFSPVVTPLAHRVGELANDIQTLANHTGLGIPGTVQFTQPVQTAPMMPMQNFNNGENNYDASKLV